MTVYIQYHVGLEIDRLVEQDVMDFHRDIMYILIVFRGLLSGIGFLVLSAIEQSLFLLFGSDAVGVGAVWF